jgi:hypothetical protein
MSASWAYNSGATKKQIARAVSAFTIAVKSNGVGGIEVESITPETFQIEVNLPVGLQVRALKTESSVNLLKISTVIYNNDLESKPELGKGKVIVFLGNEKMEYDFKVHSITFDPTIDLEDTKITANISSSDDNMIRRLMQDKVLSFYISGKLTENKNKEVETIVISKISPHVDQTAYAKRFQKIKEKSGIMDDLIIKDTIFNEPNVDMSKIVKAVDAWNKFRKITKDVVMEYDDLKKKEASIFSKWRKAIKSKLT